MKFEANQNKSKAITEKLDKSIHMKVTFNSRSTSFYLSAFGEDCRLFASPDKQPDDSFHHLVFYSFTD